jgi:ankyrin repeat protein
MAATGDRPTAPWPPETDIPQPAPQSNFAAKQNPAGNQFVTGARSRAAAGDAGEAGTLANAAPPVTAERRSLDPAAQLRRAAEIGDIAKLQMLLEQQPVIEARDGDGRTALLLAAQHGQSVAVDVLLAHGADPNAADAHGATPLQAALAAHEPAIAAALRRAGAQ